MALPSFSRLQIIDGLYLNGTEIAMTAIRSDVQTGFLSPEIITPDRYEWKSKTPFFPAIMLPFWLRCSTLNLSIRLGSSLLQPCSAVISSRLHIDLKIGTSETFELHEDARPPKHTTATTIPPCYIPTGNSASIELVLVNLCEMAEKKTHRRQSSQLNWCKYPRLGLSALFLVFDRVMAIDKLIKFPPEFHIEVKYREQAKDIFSKACVSMLNLDIIPKHFPRALMLVVKYSIGSALDFWRTAPTDFEKSNFLPCALTSHHTKETGVFE